MAPHSSTLAWKIPGTAEPGGLPSVGSHICMCMCVCIYFGCTEYSLWCWGFSSFAVSRCGLSSCSACAWLQLLSSPTRDRTWTPCLGSMESHPLDPGCPVVKPLGFYCKERGSHLPRCMAKE